MLIRNKQLCSTCREIKMVQPRTMTIPHNLKLSFENFMSHRMMSLHPPKAPTVPECSRNDISTESVRYRLPILGPRTAVFHGLLADTYATLQETQLSSLPGKEPTGKTMRQMQWPCAIPGAWLNGHWTHIERESKREGAAGRRRGKAGTPLSRKPDAMRDSIPGPRDHDPSRAEGRCSTDRATQAPPD
ncbi:uncharacterized protein C1orf105 homolog isoform X2 [Ursus arctos]|nr:uncharacterized protein C1orf105 homolog isoform X2 [Ursus arctos]